MLACNLSLMFMLCLSLMWLPVSTLCCVCNWPCICRLGTKIIKHLTELLVYMYSPFYSVLHTYAFSILSGNGYEYYFTSRSLPSFNMECILQSTYVVTSLLIYYYSVHVCFIHCTTFVCLFLSSGFSWTLALDEPQILSRYHPNLYLVYWPQLFRKETNRIHL
jgi:hypothetical protein